MSLLCQKNSYLKEVSFSCSNLFLIVDILILKLQFTEAAVKSVQRGKIESIDGFDIVLEDTIFFPEGGGQV